MFRLADLERIPLRKRLEDRGWEFLENVSNLASEWELERDITPSVSPRGPILLDCHIQREYLLSGRYHEVLVTEPDEPQGPSYNLRGVYVKGFIH